MHARRENLKVCQHIACKHHHQSCGKRPQWWKERACGGNSIWKRHCTSNLYLRVRASIIRQEIPNCWVDTLKAMLWVRHIASLLSSLCSVCDMLLCVQMCCIIFIKTFTERKIQWNFGRKRKKLILRKIFNTYFMKSAENHHSSSLDD